MSSVSESRPALNLGKPFPRGPTGSLVHPSNAEVLQKQQRVTANNAVTLLIFLVPTAGITVRYGMALKTLINTDKNTVKMISMVNVVKL